MELALVTGLGLIGTYIANNKKDAESDPIIEKIENNNNYQNNPKKRSR